MDCRECQRSELQNLIQKVLFKSRKVADFYLESSAKYCICASSFVLYFMYVIHFMDEIPIDILFITVTCLFLILQTLKKVQ